MTEKVIESFSRLSTYCIRDDFKGYDPFDGLNSRLFQSIPFLNNNRLVRLAWIQFIKKCPINLRSLIGISKNYNPKALGLFLSGYCNLYETSQKTEILDKIIFLSEKLENLGNT